MRQFDSVRRAVAHVLSLTLGTAMLGACGGTDSGSGATTPATTTQNLSMTVSAPEAAPSLGQPTFHLAPVLLEEPEETDRFEPMRSATLAPHQAVVRSEFAQLSSRRLTPQIMQEMLETGSAPQSALARGTVEDPMTSASTVSVYTPAQIRAAYGLPTLSTNLTSAQTAQLGAGQTIYLIDAQDDPNSAAELASFNSKFGLPGCTSLPISTSATLPLAAAPTTGCVFSVVYSTANGTIAPTAPTYNAGWATEIAIDVQWAHATAPYARIILIEAPDGSVTSLSAAVHLANTMGPGVVSQSFGSAEGSWTSAFDANYTVANMTYLAATGDAGAEVDWPAVSSHVLAVAGTTLNYSGTGPRSETVWSGSGAGVSAYVTTPNYQGLAVPGLNKPAYRAVSDVTFNADPNSGQYLALMPQGANAVSWYSAGGTSLATPQWAGLIAIANAMRAHNSVAPIGGAQSLLYGLAVQASSYATSFLDVTKGSDGTCQGCNAGVGYDLPSGLGSPNAAGLLTALAAQPPSVAPVVTSATVSGTTGTVISFAISAAGTHALTYSLSNAPAGMSVNASTGIVSWTTPVLGTYVLVAHAFDATTGLSGQGTITLSVLAPQPPKVTGGSVSGTAYTALLFSTLVTDTNAVTLSLSGAPSGMVMNNAGVVSWASPLAGTYAVTLIAHDAITGLSGQGIYTVSIAAPAPPVVSAATIGGTVGKAISFNVNVPSTDPLTFSLSGAPSGVSIVSSTGLVTWANPTPGSHAVTVKATDTKTGLSGTGIYTLSIITGGPALPAVSWTGVAGKAFSGSITISDSNAGALSILVSGIPPGLSFTASGSVLSATWNSPVTGVYSLHVMVIDAKNLTGTTTIPLTITAH